MKRIELTEEQVESIKHALMGIREESRDFDIDIEIDDCNIANISGWVELDGYSEDDYYSGTGGWVETHREVSVDITIIDEFGNEHSVDRDSENEIYNYLMRK